MSRNRTVFLVDFCLINLVNITSIARRFLLPPFLRPHFVIGRKVPFSSLNVNSPSPETNPLSLKEAQLVARDPTRKPSFRGPPHTFPVFNNPFPPELDVSESQTIFFSFMVLSQGQSNVYVFFLIFSSYPTHFATIGCRRFERIPPMVAVVSSLSSAQTTPLLRV